MNAKIYISLKKKKKLFYKGMFILQHSGVYTHINRIKCIKVKTVIVNFLFIILLTTQYCQFMQLEMFNASHYHIRVLLADRPLYFKSIMQSLSKWAGTWIKLNKRGKVYEKIFPHSCSILFYLDKKKETIKLQKLVMLIKYQVTELWWICQTAVQRGKKGQVSLKYWEASLEQLCSN